MDMNKLIVAVVFSAFAILPVRASSDAATSGTILQGQLTPTAASACAYGYAKSEKTGKCVELKCADDMMLDKNGHKCIAKPKAKSTGSSTPRGSY